MSAPASINAGRTGPAPSASCFRTSRRSRCRSLASCRRCRLRRSDTRRLAASLEGSLGVNGFLFPWLREHVPGYAGLRVPARFSMLVGLTLAVLSGYGAARILNRWPRFQGVITGAMVAAVLVDATPYLELEPVWSRPPS